MRIGLVEIELDEYVEVKGPNEIWVWKRNGDVRVVYSAAPLMRRLVDEWKESKRETYEGGLGI
jgi:hypothetical protein